MVYFIFSLSNQNQSDMYFESFDILQRYIYFLFEKGFFNFIKSITVIMIMACVTLLIYHVLFYVSAVLITCIIYIFHAYTHHNYCFISWNEKINHLFS
jgi:hypothetical protein